MGEDLPTVEGCEEPSILKRYLGLRVEQEICKRRVRASTRTGNLLHTGFPNVASLPGFLSDVICRCSFQRSSIWPWFRVRGADLRNQGRRIEMTVKS